MTDDLSMGELARTVESIRRDVREDLNEFGRRLDQLVLRDVYLADQRALLDRMNRMEQEQRDDRIDATRQIAEIRADTTRQVTEIKAEMGATKTRTLSIVGAIITSAGVIVAILGFFITK
jgi:hypothetical protein